SPAQLAGVHIGYSSDATAVSSSGVAAAVLGAVSVGVGCGVGDAELFAVGVAVGVVMGGDPHDATRTRIATATPLPASTRPHGIFWTTDFSSCSIIAHVFSDSSTIAWSGLFS